MCRGFTAVGYARNGTVQFYGSRRCPNSLFVYRLTWSQ